jgi:hypothetical protein
MPGPVVDIGNNLVAFIDPQTSFKTAATDYPEAADALRVLAGCKGAGRTGFSFYEDKRGTATKLGIVKEKREASCDLEFYLYLTTAGTKPDWTDILESGGWQAITGVSTTVSGGGATTTVIPVASAAGFTAGGCVEISGEVRRITLVNTVPAPDEITVSPPLSTAPADGAAVTAGVSYKPKDARATSQDAITAWIGNNRSTERFIGWLPSSLSLSLGGAGAARATVTGPARRRDFLGATKLNGGINNSTTTIVVDDGTACPSDAATTLPFYFTIDSEVIKVIAVSGNTWTTDTRGVYAHGGAAASHLDDAEVYPAVPTGTYAGTPVAATSGQVIINSETMALDTVSLDCDMGLVLREDEFGDDFKIAGFVLGQRSIKVQASGSSYYDSSAVRIEETFNRTAVQFFAQQGSASGAIVAIELPTVRLESPDIDRGADEVQFSFSGEANGTTSEDEVYIMVA